MPQQDRNHKEINYLEENYDGEQKSEPKYIFEKSKTNRMLPDKNDQYGIKLKFNG